MGKEKIPLKQSRGADDLDVPCPHNNNNNNIDNNNN